jgi:O-antigen/teichoic acid export membrane protein
MLLRNTATNLAGLVAALLLALATTAVLAKQLGPAAFGVLVLVRAIVGNAGLLETLFGFGVMRYVAFHHARGEVEQRNQYVASGVVVNLVQGLALSVVLIIAAGLLFDRVFVGVPPGLRHEGIAMLYVFFIVFILQICSTTLGRAIEGLQAYPAIRVSELLMQILLLVSLVIFLRSSFRGTLHNIAWLYVGVEAIRLVVYAALLRSYGIVLSLRSAFDRRTFRALFDYGRPLFVGKVFTTIGYRGDALILAAFLSVEAVASYQVANQVWSAAIAGLAALTSALLPAMAEQHARSISRLRSLFIRASRYSFCAALLGATFVVLMREVIVEGWVGPQYRPAELIIVLFMTQVVVAYHQGVSSTLALSTMSHHPMGKLEAIGGVCNLALSLLLVQWYGAAGVVIAGIVKTAVVAPFYVLMATRTLEISWRTFWAQCIWPVWQLMIAIAFTVLLARQIGSAVGVEAAVGVALQVIAAGIVSMAVVWTMILNPEDRTRVRHAVAFQPS